MLLLKITVESMGLLVKPSFFVNLSNLQTIMSFSSHCIKKGFREKRQEIGN